VIADIVTELIIDGLEPVDVEHQQRQRPPVALVSAPFDVGERQEMPPVKQPGHPVDSRHLL